MNLKAFSSSLEETPQDSDVKFTTEVKAKGDVNIGSGGIQLTSINQNTSSVSVNQTFNINAQSLNVESDSEGIKLSSGAEGAPIYNVGVHFKAYADTFNIIGKNGQALNVDGSNTGVTETDGTSLYLEGKNFVLKGGRADGGMYADNIAVCVTQTAKLEISGKENSSFNVEATQVNPASEGAIFGNSALYARYSEIDLHFDKNSSLDIKGSLVTMGADSVLNLKAIDSSTTVINGGI